MCEKNSRNVVNKNNGSLTKSIRILEVIAKDLIHAVDESSSVLNKKWLI